MINVEMVMLPERLRALMRQVQSHVDGLCQVRDELRQLMVKAEEDEIRRGNALYERDPEPSRPCEDVRKA